MRRMARKNVTSVELGYVHPSTNQWHYKNFTNVADADAAKNILLSKGIPCAQLTNTKVFSVYGCDEETFLSSFIGMGDEWDIENEDDLVYVVFRKIVDQASNDMVTIGTKQFFIKSDMIRQDEQWASVYGSYGGYDKVGTYSLHDNDDEEVICFYWPL